jgi:transcriptional regulator with XRE-family HTH domain
MAPNRRLKQARELRGWSQARVAEMIGTDATTVSRWERGLFLPTPYFREKLCECFGKNAEELGLLEAETEPHLHSVVGPDTYEGSGLYGQTPTAGRGEMVALKPRSSPENVDTFTYILQRSSQEQQAYMLWEHAYVQALQDQPAEAQRLGQASVNVFEQVRHPNAAVVRAWLHQQGLLPTSSPSDAPRPSDIQRKRTSRPWLRVGGASVFVVLVLVAGIVLSGVMSNHSTSSLPGDARYSPLAPGGNSSSNTPVPDTNKSHTTSPVVSAQSNTAQIVEKDHGFQVPAPTPIPPSTTTPPPQPTSTTSSGGVPDPSIMPTITPVHLNPQNCYVDGMGYRCMLTLTVYANTNETFSWQASSTGIPTKFNSQTGTAATGDSFQMIVYIYAPCSQNGTISFGFQAPSSKHTNTVSASWSC